MGLDGYNRYKVAPVARGPRWTVALLGRGYIKDHIWTGARPILFFFVFVFSLTLTSARRWQSPGSFWRCRLFCSKEQSSARLSPSSRPLGCRASGSAKHWRGRRRRRGPGPWTFVVLARRPTLGPAPPDVKASERACFPDPSRWLRLAGQAGWQQQQKKGRDDAKHEVLLVYRECRV